MVERPHLQPELPEKVSGPYLRWRSSSYPAASLPMIARSIPGNNLLIMTRFMTIMALSAMVFFMNNAACASSFLVVMSLMFVMPLLMKSGRQTMNRKWHAWAVKHKDQLCLDCGQSLHNLAETGTCPSCTQPYSLESSRWGWRKWRHVPDLPEEPPSRPGPLHASRPCPSMLAGSPRSHRLFLLFESLALLTFFIAFVLFAQLFDLGGYGLLTLIVLLVTAILLALHMLPRRARRLATELDDLLCPECSYRLDDREARGTCPECGFYYTFANCRWAWRHLRKDEYNQPTPPPLLTGPVESGKQT